MEKFRRGRAVLRVPASEESQLPSAMILIAGGASLPFDDQTKLCGSHFWCAAFLSVE